MSGFAFATGLGFGFFAYLVLFLGLISCLYSWLIYLILLAITIFLFYSKRSPITEIVKNRISFQFFRSFISKSLLILVILIVAVINILGALTPEVRQDSLQYHQTIPHYFLLEHRIAEVPYTIYYTYSLNAEMIYTLGLAIGFGNSMMPKLFHGFAALLTAIAVYGLAKKYSDNSLVALISTAIFYTLPQVAWMSSSAFNENWWMLFGVLAITTWLEWYDSNQKQWLYLSALFCGFGIGTKLIAVMFYPFLLGIATLIRSQKSEVRSQKSNSSFLLLASSFCLLAPVVPWLIRNYIYTANPIYPLLSSLFNSPHPYDIAGKNFAAIRSLPLMTISGILDRIWNSFTAININGNGILTAFFIICIPLLVLKIVPTQIKWLTGYGLIVWLIYAVVEGGTDGRFIYPSYPLLAIAIGYAIYLAIDRIKKYQRSIVLLLCFIMLGTFAHMKYAFVQDFNESWLPVFGEQNQERYLAERIEIYPMLQYINENLPQDTKVLLPRAYAGIYCSRRYLAHSEFDISPLEDLIARYHSADQIYTQLRAWSLTHIVTSNVPNQNPVIAELLTKYTEKKIELDKFVLYSLKN
jgi:hypothetical protein